MKRTVAIVEDDAGIRDNLQALLNSSPGYRCVCACGSGERALVDIPHFHPDVVLMDINLPEMSGIECVARLRVKMPDLLVVMLTAYDDGDNIFRALKAGASGYLVKRLASDKLLEAIEDACNGGSPMSCQIARKVVQFFHHDGTAEDGAETLSPREHQILDLLVTGCFFKEIAGQLGISGETVRTHVNHIYQKLHVRSRTEAVVKYLRTK
jgi:hypothetical protein